MTRQEQVQNLAKIARISVSYAEDLYDSFFPKPVVPQYVADWYEENKGDFEVNFWAVLIDWNRRERKQSFNEWFDKTDNSIQTIVNMHQFGYEVEKEPRYTVRIKGITSKRNCLNYFVEDGKWYINDEVGSVAVRTQHTRKELEQGGFGEVFDNPMFEVEEVE